MKPVATPLFHDLWYAVDDDTYDGAPDAGFKARIVGQGKTEEAAIQNLLEQHADLEP